MLRRILTAAVGLPLLFAALWWGGPLGIVLLTLLAALLALREFYGMFPRETPQPLPEPAAATPESAPPPQNPLAPNPLPGQPEPVDEPVHPGQVAPQNPPASEPAASQNPPLPEPAASQNPPLPEPAASQNPPLPEPAASQNPPASDPAASQNPPALEPAASPNPLILNPIAGRSESNNPPLPEPAASQNPLILNLLKDAPLPLPLGMFWAAAFVLGGWVSDGPGQFWTISLIILTAGAFLSLLWLLAFYHGRRGPETAAWLLAGPLYVGFLLAHIPLLAQLGLNGDLAGHGYELGRSWLIFALLTTFATDSGAYFVGRLLGRRKMAPKLSPGKTWEGAAGGLAAAVVAALLLPLLPAAYLNLQLTWPAAALMGLALGIAAQAGDLLESGLKRRAGVKDAGRLFPGHGGLLDRLDSLLLTLPLTYYLALLAFRYGG